MRKSLVVFGTAAVLMLAPCWSQAHMFWLLTDRDTVQVNESVQVAVNFGHKFPKDEELKEGRLEFLKALGPDGRETALKKLSEAAYEFVPPAAGVYVLAGRLTPGFVTRTPQGMKLQNKKGVPDANLCFRFDMGGKTIVQVGEAGQGFDRSSRSALEIVPLKSLSGLKAGESLPVRIMFQGKPLAQAKIQLTHEGWSDPKTPFAAQGVTDNQGEFQVKLDQPGRWLLVCTHKTPYENPEECDENLFSTSLTWRVR